MKIVITMDQSEIVEAVREYIKSHNDLSISGTTQIDLVPGKGTVGPSAVISVDSGVLAEVAAKPPVKKAEKAPVEPKVICGGETADIFKEEPKAQPEPAKKVEPPTPSVESTEGLFGDATEEGGVEVEETDSTDIDNDGESVDVTEEEEDVDATADSNVEDLFA
jgi:hypothetical protein